MDTWLWHPPAGTSYTARVEKAVRVMDAVADLLDHNPADNADVVELPRSVCDMLANLLISASESLRPVAKNIELGGEAE